MITVKEGVKKMLKKCIVILSILMVFALGIATANSNDFKNLNGDVHYDLMYWHRDGGSYLKTDSVRIVFQNDDAIYFSATTASAQIRDSRTGETIFPARHVKKRTVKYGRRYSNPWNIVYINNGEGYQRLDLSNEFGYNMSSIITFANVWYIATGTTYPNLGKYTNY